MRSNFDEEHRAIVQAISDECEAFYLRDYERWAKHWLHDDCVQRLGVLAGGQLVSQRGWVEESENMAKIMRDNPIPNPSASSEVRRENMVIRVFGEIAWAAYDQFTPRSDDIFVNVGLSHQVRIFEKHEGRWKVVLAAHGDTTVGYLDFPAISVERNGSIIWSNEAAQKELPTHPILMLYAGHLCARTRADTKALLAAIVEIDALTPMDIRLSISQNSSNKTATPIIFADPFDTISHIVWVAKVDGQVLVSFYDQKSEKNRLTGVKALYGLSDAQMALAELIIEGCDLVQAAERMNISVTTSRTHLSRIFDKTGVRSQTALVRTLLSAQVPRA